MGYLYSLSKFQPNVAIKWGQADDVSQYSAGVSWRKSTGSTSPEIGAKRVCQMCAISAKLGQIRRRSAGPRIVARC